MHYFLIAGEASGDEHGAHLIAALREADETASFCFVGGDKMTAAAGVSPLYHYESLAVMGIAEVIRSMGHIRAAARRVQQTMTEIRPDLIIPIDYGGFDLKYVLPHAHRIGIPVIYYIPPKVWASRRGRIKQLREQTVLSLTILPFEADYLNERGVAARYVGNPSIESVGGCVAAYARQTASDEPYIALLPGSRIAEVRRNLPAMCRALELLPDKYRAVVAQAPGLPADIYAPYIDGGRVSLSAGRTYALLARADLAIVTSGTANLETALIGTPQVVCYKTALGRLARWGFRHFFPIDYFSLTNLLADAPVADELLGSDVTPERIARSALPLLDRSSRPCLVQQQGYARIRARLGNGIASTQAAGHIVGYLRQRETETK